MMELFYELPKTDLSDRLDYLIDTCFIVWVFEHQRIKEFLRFITDNNCAITSFNAEELNHIHRKLHKNINKSIRKFLHQNKRLKLLMVPVHPGEVSAEHEFVKSIFPLLEEKERDPSDAVLLAAAIRTRANILTRDKHDLFNVLIEKVISDYHIIVLNTFPN